jgi:FixJ family two-component response regulator
MTIPPGKVLVLDDDEAVCRSLKRLFNGCSMACEAFQHTDDLLRAWPADEPCCLILDVHLGGVDGYSVVRNLRSRGIVCPVVFLTAHGDVPSAVAAMRNGAEDFLTKPYDPQELLRAVTRALDKARKQWREKQDTLSRRARAAKLTAREREVLSLAASGLVNKQIASKLGIAEITVKIHRASGMRQLGARTSAELARFADLLDIPP